MAKYSTGEKIFETVIILILVFITLLCAYPILYVLFASLSNATELVRAKGPLFYPKGFTVEAYSMVFKNPNIQNGYRNTLIYLVLGTTINMVLTTICAYVLSRSRFTLQRFFSFLITFTMFFNGGLVPTYLLIKNLSMIDTIWALVLPGAISVYNMIIMRTSFAGIPPALEESARLDGANDLRILLSVVIPLSMPVIAVLILFYGVYHWNSWFNAMLYIRTRSKYPLQLILREILIASSTTEMTVDASAMDRENIDDVIKYATIVVATFPILCAYPFLQRFFVKGIMVGAVKG